jgi:taurine dioxygenase
MPSFEIAPLPGHSAFGAMVTNLRPDQIDDLGAREALYDLWIDRGLIIFKGLSSLDAQIRLSEIFGDPAVHPLLEGVDRPREHDVIAPIDYGGDEGDIYEVNGELRGGYLPWHFDLAYMPKINHGGILRAEVLPERGGETGFIDRIAAYDAMPAELKRRIAFLSVIYQFTGDPSLAKFGERPTQCVRTSRSSAMSGQHPNAQLRVIHPLVYVQAETGRKVLNVSPWFAEGIEGMENAEGDALLAEVVAYATRPELAYFHSWTTGDMLLWDNWRMLHCATGVPIGDERRMRRTTIAGDYALGRREAA